jgi:hypothetical protein
MKVALSMKKPVMFFLAAALALAGCAGASQSQKPDPLNRKELLAFAGFKLKVAVTQEDINQIAGIPQRELLRVASSNPTLYVWADATGCRCYYVGDETAYRRLEAIVLETGKE